MKLRIFIFTFLLFSTFCIQAENNYEFKSNILFKHEMTISIGELESYSMNSNSEVKLLIGLFDKKTFLSEAQALSENEMKNTFLQKSTLVDPINGQSEREIIGFKKTKTTDGLLLTMKYYFQKDGVKWVEATTYALSNSGVAMASLQYPFSLNEIQKLELDKGIETFQLESGIKKTVFIKIKDSFKNLISFYKDTHFDLGILLIEKSFADEASEKFKGCNKKGYILQGEFTTKPGSALFNFKKIFKDLKDEVNQQSIQLEDNKKAKINDTKINCLANFYKEAKKNARDYWSKRGNDEGCFSDSEIIAQSTDSCSDSTLKEMKKSFAYLDNIDNEFADFMTGEKSEKVACNPPKTNNEEVDQFKKLNASVQQTFCCSNGEGGQLDKGPLLQLMESESESFTSLSSNTKIEMCIKKTATDPKKNFLSADGLGECAESFFQGLGKLIKDTIKTISSLFDLETIKALGKLVADMPESGKDLIKVIGEQLGGQLYSVTDCMSPYESKQYICKMIPSVAATLLGPGMIKSFAKAIVDKTSKTALAQIVLKAASENKQFQKVKNIASKASAGIGKVSKPILKSRFIKPSIDILNKITKILGKDLSTPLKEMVIKNAIKIKAAAHKLKVSASKILKKPEVVSVVAEEVAEDASLVAKRASMGIGAKQPVAEMVEGSDGVFREVKLSESRELSVPSKALTTTDGLKIYTPTQVEMISDSSAFRRAVAAGNDAEAAVIKERMLTRAAELSDADRIKLAESLTRDGSPFTKEQQDLIIAAHNVGEGRGFGTYTTDDLRKKTKFLVEAGITNEADRRILMEAGITGNDSRQFFKDNFRTHFSKVLGKPNLSVSQTEAIYNIHGSETFINPTTKAKLTHREQLINGGFTEKEADLVLQAKKVGTVKSTSAPAKAAEVKPAVAEVKPAVVEIKAVESKPAPVIAKVESEAAKGVRRNFANDQVHNYETKPLGSNASEADKYAYTERARKEAKLILDKHFGKAEMDIYNSIQEDGAEIAKANRRMEAAREKLTQSKPKSSDAIAAQNEMDRAEVSLESYRKRCANWVKLYAAAYGVQDHLRSYEDRYNKSCK